MLNSFLFVHKLFHTLLVSNQMVICLFLLILWDDNKIKVQNVSQFGLSVRKSPISIRTRLKPLILQAKVLFVRAKAVSYFDRIKLDGYSPNFKKIYWMITLRFMKFNVQASLTYLSLVHRLLLRPSHMPVVLQSLVFFVENLLHISIDLNKMVISPFLDCFNG